MIVSIHQPQYIPWLPYFYKILHSDVFVLFDTVQYPRGKGWANRNQVKTANGVALLTVPVQKRSEVLPFAKIPIAGSRWQTKHWRTIEMSYRAAPYFDSYAGELQELYLRREWKWIVDLNGAFLQFCLGALDIDAEVVRASTLNAFCAGQDSTSYILSILRELRTDRYISGRGAGSQRYVDSDVFLQNRIELNAYEFRFPEYQQSWGDFVPGLSVLDTILNCGPGARVLLEQAGRLVEW